MGAAGQATPATVLSAVTAQVQKQPLNIVGKMEAGEDGVISSETQVVH